MRIVQLENEISARIEDVNRDFISKDKIRKVINDLSYPIENDKRFIDTENLKIFFKKIKELLEE